MINCFSFPRLQNKIGPCDCPVIRGYSYNYSEDYSWIKIFIPFVLFVCSSFYLVLHFSSDTCYVVHRCYSLIVLGGMIAYVLDIMCLSFGRGFFLGKYPYFWKQFPDRSWRFGESSQKIDTADQCGLTDGTIVIITYALHMLISLCFHAESVYTLCVGVSVNM